jgi:hypothetical protein
MDHAGLSKFPARQDPFFGKLIEIIQGLLPTEQIPCAATPDSSHDHGVDAHDNGPSGSSNATRLSAVLTPTSTIIPGYLNIRQGGSATNAVKLPCHILRPYQLNQDFVGRENVKQRIHDRLAPQARAKNTQNIYSLCGLGGTGKTQTALSFVFDSLKEFEIILWAHADNRSKLFDSFSSLAKDMKIVDPDENNLVTCRDSVKRYLEITGKIVTRILPSSIIC